MDFLLQIVAIIVSVMIILALEGMRKPRLKFVRGESGVLFPNDPHGRQPAKWTHVYVYNEPMPKWLSWAFDRNPAIGCHGWITFHALDGRDLFDKRMPIRWADNLEPVIQDPKTCKAMGIDWDKMRTGGPWDIPPGDLTDGEYGNLDVVFRAKSDSECHGWNNDSYLFNWRNPEWKLDKGRYLAKIVIRTGGQSFTEIFEIMNQGRYEDFRLVESDKKLL